MRKLLGTTATIEEARQTAMHRKYWLIVLMFLSVYFVGSLLSSLILLGPMTFHISTNEELMKLIESGVQDQEVLVNTVYETMPEWMNVVNLLSSAGIIIAVLYYCTHNERRRVASLGFIKKGAVLEYLLGLVIGLVMFVSVLGIIYPTDGIINFAFNSSVSIPLIVLYFLGFVVQGASEEILLRGFFFVSGSYSSNVVASFFISSFVFAGFHIGNSGVTVLSFINVFLFGAFAALYYLRRGSIWGICAIHSMWNFAQGNIFGFNVSGADFGQSLFTVQSNNELFAGGQFGPEGGLAVTIVLLIAIAILLPMKNKRVEIPPIRLKGEFQSA